jgi:nucleoside-diphosphate-sugar epimerase
MTTPSSDWRGRTVLVTGGAGFLGANLCHALVERGARVRVIDAFLAEGGACLANLRGAEVELARGDIGAIDLRALVRGTDVIFNLAARTGHMDAQHDPYADAAVNVLAQLRLIAAARKDAPAAVVVHASTRQVYGRPRQLPVTEDHPVAPPDANAIAKLAGEEYWMMEHRVRAAPVVALRLTNCYGPRMRIRDGRQSFLGAWIGQVLRRRPFEVWGGDHRRDLTFVDDVTAAFLAAAATPACHGRVFNIGGSAPASLRELADMVVRVGGKGAAYVTRELPADRAKIDIGSYHADDRAFRGATGWTAGTDFADGLARTLDWFRRNGADYL